MNLRGIKCLSSTRNENRDSMKSPATRGAFPETYQFSAGKETRQIWILRAGFKGLAPVVFEKLEIHERFGLGRQLT